MNFGGRRKIAPAEPARKLAATHSAFPGDPLLDETGVAFGQVPPRPEE